MILSSLSLKVKYNYRESFNLNESQITSLVNSINSNQNTESNQLKLDESKETFRLNDRLWILLANNVLAYLTLPDQINSICMDRSSVGYLSDKKTRCRLKNVDFDCSTKRAKKFYDIKNYLGFKFLPVRRK